ncbi:MAG: hypothetical protein PHY12_07495 [Eubacteriales bacterium]|nr:hypothetical protein [Eubacteriales bacterium]
MMEGTARTRRIASFAITALLMVLALALSRVVFQTVDDNAIAMAASGGVTGAPYAGNCYTSYGYGWLIAALYGLCPGFPWHAALMLIAEALAL